MDRAWSTHKDTATDDRSESATVPAWRDQDPILKDMWLQGIPEDEIAVALGRTATTIIIRASRLRLPRLRPPGSQPLRLRRHVLSEPAGALQTSDAIDAPRPATYP